VEGSYEAERSGLGRHPTDADCGAAIESVLPCSQGPQRSENESFYTCKHMGKMRVGAIKHKNMLAVLKILIKSYVFSS
jgi:hypothetical protein